MASVTAPEQSDQEQQNRYYRKGFRIMIRLANAQAVIIFVLVCALAFYVKTKENKDRYFAENGEDRMVQMDGLKLPNMGKIAIANWVAMAAGQIMTFGFNDIDERFAVSQKNFTKEGWESFRRAMLQSKLLDDMVASQQIITAVPDSPPVLTQEGLMNDRYSWTFNVSLLVTIRSGGVKTSQPKSVQMTIEMIPTWENPNGIGISEWYIY